MKTVADAIEQKTAVIGIIGLGYVGLPLACAFADKGFKVVGFDISAPKVESLNQGISSIVDVCDEDLSRVINAGRFQATIDQARLPECDAVFICVPTPVSKNKEPDLSYVITESKVIATYLRPGQIVILESTTYPGTTQEIVCPILEQSNLKAGKDFFLAYSPERVDPGSQSFSIKNVAKLVGGIDPESTKQAALLYSQIAENVFPVSSSGVAEMSKVFENVFRNVNIALVNELALLCENMGISVWEVIEAASTKPFGFMRFNPGPGVGGHCIPVDPYYLASKAREFNIHTRFIELAAYVNEEMPSNVTSHVIEILSTAGKAINKANILLLGVAFKKDVSDTRESPALRILNLLMSKGASVSYNDPFVPSIKLGRGTLTSVELTAEVLAAADCVIIATDHSSYDYTNIIKNARIVYDTRGATCKLQSPNIVRLGEPNSRQPVDIASEPSVQAKPPTILAKPV